MGSDIAGGGVVVLDAFLGEDADDIDNVDVDVDAVGPSFIETDKVASSGVDDKHDPFLDSFGLADSPRLSLFPWLSLLLLLLSWNLNM